MDIHQNSICSAIDFTTKQILKDKRYILNMNEKKIELAIKKGFKRKQIKGK